MMRFALSIPRPRRPVSALLGALALWLGIAGAPGAAQDAETYRLGPADRVLIRVVVWDPEAGAFEQWDAIGGEYGVGPDGELMLPLVGPVTAAGLTAAELAEAISAGMEERISLAEPPSTSVEVVQHRPVYVLGDVERPGEYPFRPGLRAIQAYAMAGGAPRLTDEAGGGGGVVDVIRSSGALREIRLELARLHVREARLQAEINDAGTFDAPEGLTHPDGPEALAAVLAQERALFETRKDRLARGLDALADLRNLLEAEIIALETKESGQTRQVGMVRERVGDLESLVEKGIARSPTLLDLQRTLIELEARQLDLETGVFRAKQEINQVERDTIDLLARRAIDSSLELLKTRAEIEALATREVTLRQVLAERGGAVALTQFESAAQGDALFRIRRRRDGDVVVFEADADTPLEPLDVVEVRQAGPLLDAAPAATSAAPG